MIDQREARKAGLNPTADHICTEEGMSGHQYHSWKLHLHSQSAFLLTRSSATTQDLSTEMHVHDWDCLWRGSSHSILCALCPVNHRTAEQSCCAKGDQFRRRGLLRSSDFLKWPSLILHPLPINCTYETSCLTLSNWTNLGLFRFF